VAHLSRDLTVPSGRAEVPCNVSCVSQNVACSGRRVPPFVVAFPCRAQQVPTFGPFAGRFRFAQDKRPERVSVVHRAGLASGRPRRGPRERRPWGRAAQRARQWTRPSSGRDEPPDVVNAVTREGIVPFRRRAACRGRRDVHVPPGTGGGTGGAAAATPHQSSVSRRRRPSERVRAVASEESSSAGGRQQSFRLNANSSSVGAPETSHTSPRSRRRRRRAGRVRGAT